MYSLADYFAEKIQMRPFEERLGNFRSGNPVVISEGGRNQFGIGFFNGNFYLGGLEMPIQPDFMAVLEDRVFRDEYDFLIQIGSDWKPAHEISNYMNNSPVVLSYPSGIAAGILTSSGLIQHPYNELVGLGTGMQSFKDIQYGQSTSLSHLVPQREAPLLAGLPPGVSIGPGDIGAVLGYLMKGAQKAEKETGRGITVNIARIEYNDRRTYNLTFNILAMIGDEGIKLVREMYQHGRSDQEILNVLIQNGFLQSGS